MYSSTRVRSDFLEFFAEREHTVVPSSPVVPRADPTLLFTNAGMNQFKDVFLGENARPYRRAASSQKCLRVSGKHNDLEVVGRDTYHHTFFEMLGNWSFGDYYKREAIRWAWELLTGVWKLPAESLYATVFEGDEQVPFDEEAWEYWHSETDIPRAQILKFGHRDNFWEMGETGPCGPCSEIHIDRGEAFGELDPRTCFVNMDSDRFIELWNLVFIQYHRGPDGELTALPQKHVDTGAGFERICAVLQNVVSNYDTDVFQPLIQRVAQLSGVGYSEQGGTAHRVIADHVRAMYFAVTDGASPSNEGRGYVVRRLLRRAARFGRELGLKGPFMGELVQVLAETMGEVFPELRAKQAHVSHVLRGEELSFGRTLDRGLERFGELRDDLRAKGRILIPGADAFRLYDTYGFPLDLTQQMAAEHGLEVDGEGFEREMLVQRETSRSARRDTAEDRRGPWQEVRAGSSTFVGYETLDTVTGVLRWRELGDDELELVLEQTPFYGESGGQVGDRGRIRGENWEMVVRNTVTEDGPHLHQGRVEGEFNPEGPVSARVEHDLRRATERNHTATHLLHKALRIVLGDHVQQEGSLVEPGRLRFDFSHPQGLDLSEIERVERLVNEQVLENTRVSSFESTYDAALEQGVTALFGEKYGDRVRVIQVGEYSSELCGGTHLSSTGQVGAFSVISEGGVAAGIRRIEAVTGTQALLLNQRRRRSLEQVRDLLGSHGSDETEKLGKTLAEKRELSREIDRLKNRLAGLEVDAALASAEEIAGVALLALQVDGADMDQLKGMCDHLRDAGREVVALLASVNDGKPLLAAMVSKECIEHCGLVASELVKAVAPLIEGGGGGRRHLATAGGKDPAGIPRALEEFRGRVRERLRS